MIRQFFENLQPFLKRQLFGAVCLGLVILSFACAALVWLDQRNLSLRLQTRIVQGEAALATLAASPALRETLSEVRRATARIDQSLVVETNLAENLWYFYNLEEQTRVKLRDMNQLSTPRSAGETDFKLIPYTLRVNGSFPQVLNFLQQVENGPRLAKIRSFSLNRLGQEPGDVTLQLELSLLGQP